MGRQPEDKYSNEKSDRHDATPIRRRLEEGIKKQKEAPDDVETCEPKAQVSCPVSSHVSDKTTPEKESSVSMEKELKQETLESQVMVSEKTNSETKKEECVENSEESQTTVVEMDASESVETVKDVIPEKKLMVPAQPLDTMDKPNKISWKERCRKIRKQLISEMQLKTTIVTLFNDSDSDY